MTALSELLVAANAEGKSARAIARAARDLGHTLNHDTVARYLRGDHGKPDEATLIAFSAILGTPLADLRSAAGLPSELTTPYSPPPEASRLSRRQRLAVDEIIRSMLEPRISARSTSSEGGVTELRPRRRKSSSRAARHGKPEPPAG